MWREFWIQLSNPKDGAATDYLFYSDNLVIQLKLHLNLMESRCMATQEGRRKREVFRQ